MAYLEVVVPPEILDEESSGETEVEEGASVTLICKAKGVPTPRVSWQRERGKGIILRDNGTKKVLSVEGGMLNLTKVKRDDMGPYLCIANNKIPPSVSKRIMMRVNFKPTLEVPLHMFGSPVGNNVSITCRVEASPKAVNTWKKVPGDQMIITSSKYDVQEKHSDHYVSEMQLTIKNFTQNDATNYVCSSSNSLGYAESTIQVYEIPTPKEKSIEDSNKENPLTKLKNKRTKDFSGGHIDRNQLEQLLDIYPTDENQRQRKEEIQEMSDKEKHLFAESSQNGSTKQEKNNIGTVFILLGSSGCCIHITFTIKEIILFSNIICLFMNFLPKF